MTEAPGYSNNPPAISHAHASDCSRACKSHPVIVLLTLMLALAKWKKRMSDIKQTRNNLSYISGGGLVKIAGHADSAESESVCECVYVLDARGQEFIHRLHECGYFNLCQRAHRQATWLHNNKKGLQLLLRAPLPPNHRGS